MHRFTCLAAVAILAINATSASGAAPPFPPALPIPAPAEDPGTVRLPNPGTLGLPEQWETFGPGHRMVRNVTAATLTPVLPPTGKATGAAVVVAPGGAFMGLSMDSEGFMVARWLADHGVAAFVLKYRLMPTDPDPAAFGKQVMAAVSAAPTRDPDAGTGMGRAMNWAIEDGQAALAQVRAHAGDYHVDPRRVGFIGFSAGAMTTLGVALGPDPVARPDFAASIYGPMWARSVPKDAPPIFLALANDDPLFGQSADDALSVAWQKAGRPVETHRYLRGGHGFGMQPQGSSSDHWIDEFYWWMEASGFLKPR